MRDPHEPRDEFVDRLAGQIEIEVRRRNRLPQQAPRWMGWLMQSPVKTAVAIATLIVISMGLGGMAVAAAYQAQTSEQRNALVTSYEQRIGIAKERLGLVAQELRTIEQRLSVGVATQDDVLEAKLRTAEADARLKSLESQLAEVRASARDPLNAVSAPLVAGRDFVSERWRIDMAVPAAALELEKARLQTAQRRFAVGVAATTEVETSRAKMAELQAAIEGLRKKLDIRQDFLGHGIDAAMADLRVLQAEAESRRQLLMPRLEVTRQAVARTEAKFRAGLVQSEEVKEVRILLRALELEVDKVDYDLAVILRKLKEQKAGR